MMKRPTALLLALTALIAAMLLTACTFDMENAELTQVTFTRGHGSMYGSQFSITVTKDEIVYASFFPEEGANDPTEVFGAPIDQAQWESIADLVGKMSPKLEKDSSDTFFGKIINKIKPQMLDGGEFRKLTLTLTIGDKEETIPYLWPQGEDAEALEALLEKIAGAKD